MGFAEEEATYNNYNFDPVAFAWNVDPLAHKFPWQSPYSAMDNSPIWKNDPTGQSGEVVIDKQSKTLTVSSNIIVYGTMASVKTANDMAAKTQEMWNAANGTVKIDGESYKVRFEIKGQYRDVAKEILSLPGIPIVAAEILYNKNIKNNYYRLERTDNASETALSIVGSFFIGSNSGYINYDQNTETDGTSMGHEYGHGIGLGHPKSYDGKNMRVMHTERVLGDKAKDRVATQADIDELELQNLKFKNGKAELGDRTNAYYPKDLSRSYQIAEP